jgi:hypothetical protein
MSLASDGEGLSKTTIMKIKGFSSMNISNFTLFTYQNNNKKNANAIN